MPLHVRQAGDVLFGEDIAARGGGVEHEGNKIHLFQLLAEVFVDVAVCHGTHVGIHFFRRAGKGQIKGNRRSGKAGEYVGGDGDDFQVALLGGFSGHAIRSEYRVGEYFHLYLAVGARFHQFLELLVAEGELVVRRARVGNADENFSGRRGFGRTEQTERDGHGGEEAAFQHVVHTLLLDGMGFGRQSPFTGPGGRHRRALSLLREGRAFGNGRARSVPYGHRKEDMPVFPADGNRRAGPAGECGVLLNGT